MKLIVAQLGARMHYAVPSILARANSLERLYTDIYSPRAFRPVLKMMSRIGLTSLRRWQGRDSDDIPEEKIVSLNGMGLQYYWRRRQASACNKASAAYLWAGRELCRRVINHGLGNGDGVYTFNSAGLELLRYARSQGAFTVMEQTIAPGVIEDELLTIEEMDFPQWESARSKDPHRSSMNEREQMEWEMSDLILCGSEFVSEGIRASGGPADRCHVVPYGIRRPAHLPAKNSTHGPLRVLTVGAVGLRKGTPYVLAAARSLKGKAEFRMVGPLNVSRSVQELLRSQVDLFGSVPSSEIQHHFAWADVFLLPSICEGSAAACYEALGYGLPVIATPNTGSVVRDGIDGFIVPIRNPDAITEKLERLHSDRDLLALMSLNARQRSTDFSLERYGERLLSELGVFNSAS